jgi:hypothetical protein
MNLLGTPQCFRYTADTVCEHPRLDSFQVELSVEE